MKGRPSTSLWARAGLEGIASGDQELTPSNNDLLPVLLPPNMTKPCRDLITRPPACPADACCPGR